MMSGELLAFSSSKNVLMPSPTYGKKHVLKFLTTTSRFVASARKLSALARASWSRSPLEPTTTHWTSVWACSDRSRRIVPPQPISMSSLWAPMQSRRRAPVRLDARSNVSMSGRRRRWSWGGDAVGGERAQEARRRARDDGVGGHVVGDDAAGADESLLADGHVGEDGGAGADGRASLHQCRLDLPVLLGLQMTVAGGGARIGVVDEGDPVADEDVVLDDDPLAHEGVARDLAVLADLGVLLNLDEGPDLGVVAHLTPVEVDELRQPDAVAELHVGRHGQGVAHSRTARPLSFSDRSAASSSCTTRRPAIPSLRGVRSLRMHSTK